MENMLMSLLFESGILIKYYFGFSGGRGYRDSYLFIFLVNGWDLTKNKVIKRDMNEYL